MIAFLDYFIYIERSIVYELEVMSTDRYLLANYLINKRDFYVP